MPLPKKSLRKLVKQEPITKTTAQPEPVRKRNMAKQTTAGRSAAKPKQATVADQAIQCYELQLASTPIREIAKIVGISSGTVYNRIQLYMDTYVGPKVEEYRRVMFDRCERLLSNLEDGVQMGDDKSVNAYMRVLERQAKLLGTDMPTQVEATVKEVTPDAAVLQRIMEARAKSEATKAALIAQAENQDGDGG